MPSLADGPCFDKAASNVNADHPAMQTLGFRELQVLPCCTKAEKFRCLLSGVGGWVCGLHISELQRSGKTVLVHGTVSEEVLEMCPCY